MKRRGMLAVILAVALIITALPAIAFGADSSARPFNDVAKNQWYYDDVYNAYFKGLFKGTSNNSFSPKLPVTRGMFVTVLYRQAGSPSVSHSASFTDVAKGSYYEDSIEWASENKIAGGYPDGSFGPNNGLTREQVANFFYNYHSVYNKNSVSGAKNTMAFADESLVSAWAKESMEWACETGLINGREDKGKYYLAPQEIVTRAEACALFNRYNVIFNGETILEYDDYVDYDALSAYDNTRKDYWFGTQYDGLNRPVEPLRFQSDEGAEFNSLAIDSDADRKVIYLTFDEGYEAGYTGKILDVLAAKGIQAVFFVTGYYYQKSKGLVSRMINEGHVVGNHSYSHPENGMSSLNLQEQYQDLEALQNCLREDFAYEMTLFRSPAGIYSEQSMALVEALHMKSVFWSFAYGDYDTSNQPSESAALTKLKSRLHPGAVYLLHAVSATNANILGQFIDYARSLGYTFELVSNN